MLNLPAAQRDPSRGLKCNTISLIRQVFASHYDVKTLCQEWRSKNSVMLPKNLPGRINSVAKIAGKSFCVSKLREIKMGPGGGGGDGWGE